MNEPIRPDVRRPTPTELESSLREAVTSDQLRLAFQPEFDLRSGHVTAVEALVRWRHPQLGELGPEQFISIAERSGLITVIGAWVIGQSIRALSSWRDDRVVLRVNVSPVQFAATDIAALVADALHEHGVPGAQVCVELTENAPIENLDAVADSLKRLKALGVTSAIDDLATGYNTLSNLRSLEFDVIKIDRSLVSGIDHDTRAQAIVSAIVGLARSFEVAVVGEGVETDAEAATLLRLGCTHAQGHHLGKPMSAEAFGELLREAHHITHDR